MTIKWLTVMETQIPIKTYRNCGPYDHQMVNGYRDSNPH